MLRNKAGNFLDRFAKKPRTSASLALLTLLILVGVLPGLFLQGSWHVYAHSSSPTLTHAPVSPSTAITFHVVGKNIIDSKGNTFIPYGVQLIGCQLANSNFNTQNNWKTASDGATTYLTQAQVQAAHDAWHSNTVSLQISSNDLFHVAPYDASYLKFVDNVVSWTQALHMNIIIVLQDECPGNRGNDMPTQPALNFWNLLAKHYAASSNVFFDIYNEPLPADLVNPGHSDNDTVWNFWQHGGTVNGQTYLGMQTLVDAIRQDGFNNLLFADGTAAGEDINLLPKHLLTGNNIVYAIHPYIAPGAHDTVQAWDDWFGKATSAGNFPVVADEWGYSVNHVSTCMPNATTLFPQFFSYLRAKNIGIIGYALYPGKLIHAWNFSDPTDINEPCPQVDPPNPNMDPNSQGVGRLLMNYLATYSVQY